MQRSYRLLLTGLAVWGAIALGSFAPAGALPWPYSPFDQAHGLGNAYEEYQDYGGGGYYHDGIDLVTPSGPVAVYSVSAGTLTHLTYNDPLYSGLMVGEPVAGGAGWLYWHIDSATMQFDVGDPVSDRRLPGHDRQLAGRELPSHPLQQGRRHRRLPVDLVHLDRQPARLHGSASGHRCAGLLYDVPEQALRLRAPEQRRRAQRLRSRWGRRYHREGQRRHRDAAVEAPAVQARVLDRRRADGRPGDELVYRYRHLPRRRDDRGHVPHGVADEDRGQLRPARLLHDRDQHRRRRVDRIDRRERLVAYRELRRRRLLGLRARVRPGRQRGHRQHALHGRGHGQLRHLPARERAQLRRRAARIDRHLGPGRAQRGRELPVDPQPRAQQSRRSR